MSSQRRTVLERALGAAGQPSTADAAHAAGAAERLVARITAEGLADVAYATLDSPLGELHTAVTRKGVVRLGFAEQGSQETIARELAQRLSARIVHAPRMLDPLKRELDEYFAGRRTSFDVDLDWALIGPFAQRVLARTAAIPYGSHSSYGQIAAQAGSPRGARAAGNALGSNPIAIVIPCHRVLHAGGGLGGYGGGLPRKRWLLELEGVLEG